MTANLAIEPSALWKIYNSKGAGYLNAYESKRTTGANKATEAMVKKVLQDEYVSVSTKDHGINVHLRGYVSRVLGLPAASLATGYTRYETYSRKPPPNAKSLSIFHLRLWIVNNHIIEMPYCNSFDAEHGVIVADANFAYMDTNKDRTDLSLKLTLSDVLFLQYKEQSEAVIPNVPLRKLRYLVRANITNEGTGKVMEEAHALPNAPADNEIAGWKRWTLADPIHKEVIETLSGTDNGKASLFILQDWAGHLGQKSVAAVHTCVNPDNNAKNMIWEFSM